MLPGLLYRAPAENSDPKPFTMRGFEQQIKNEALDGIHWHCAREGHDPCGVRCAFLVVCTQNEEGGCAHPDCKKNVGLLRV